MKKIPALLLLSVLLTACPQGTAQNGTSGVPVNGNASVSLNLTPLQAPIAAGYRIMADDASSSGDPSGFSMTMAPSDFYVRLANIELIPASSNSKYRTATDPDVTDASNETGETVTPKNADLVLYAGTKRLNLGNKQDLATEINAKPRTIPAGTYSGLTITFKESGYLKGSFNVNGTTYYTKPDMFDPSKPSTSTYSVQVDPKVAPAEYVSFAGDGVRTSTVLFPQPLEIKGDEQISISVLYDLDGAATYMDCTKSGGAHWIDVKYMPFFAFVGNTLTPEVYDVALDDPQQWVSTYPNWHFKLMLLAGPDGSILSAQSTALTQPNYQGFGVFKLGFLDKLSQAKANGDGTYHLESSRSGYNGTPESLAYPLFATDTFKRSTHDGVVTYFDSTKDWRPQTTPVDLTYHATRIQ